VEGEEADGLLEGVHDTGDLLVLMNAGEAEAGVIVDGDVKSFDAGTFVAVGAVAGATDARAQKAAKLLYIEVDEFAGLFAFVADDGRWRRIECFEQVQTVALEDSPDRRLGDGHEHDNLGIRTTLMSEPQHVRLESGRRAPGLMFWHARSLAHSFGQAIRAHAGEPAAGSLFADAPGRCCLPERQPMALHIGNHLGATTRSEFGVSVHIVREGRRSVDD